MNITTNDPYPGTIDPTLKPPVQSFPPIIEVTHLKKDYKQGNHLHTVLSDINLSIARAEFVAIMGESGSGKSTLLQCIGCIDRPTSGSIVVDGNSLDKLTDKSLSMLRRSTLGFIFQSFYLQPFLTLMDNVAIPAMFMGKKKSDIDDAAKELLLQVGLEAYANYYPRQLSGGQIQRAAIARALINHPKIILADEPTGNLDSNNSQAVLTLLKQVVAQYETSVVVVTHSNEVASLADRIMRIKDGVML